MVEPVGFEPTTRGLKNWAALLNIPRSP